MTTEPLSLRRNFVWNLAGNVVYSIAQWLLLVAIAQVGTPTMVGAFALALALSAPVYLTVGLNLRLVRATDVARTWTPGQYQTLRQLLNLASLAITMLLGQALGVAGEGWLVLLLVCCCKSVEATSQVAYGYFQLRERLDLVARSMLGRAVLGTAGFVIGLVLSRELAPACSGLLVGWLAVWLGHDRVTARTLAASDAGAAERDGHRSRQRPGTLWSLALCAAPLGPAAGAGSLAVNVPRYAVQLSLGTAELGVFAALAYLAQVVAVITGSLGDAVVGRLAKHHHRREAGAFIRLLLTLVAIGGAVAVVAAAGAWLVGGPLVRVLLGPEYVNQPVLVLLMAGIGLHTIHRALVRGLQSSGSYRAVLAADGAVLTAMVAAAILLVPAYGLVGAGLTLCLGFLVGTVLTAALVANALRHQKSALLARELS